MTNKQQSGLPMQDLSICERSMRKSMVFGCVIALVQLPSRLRKEKWRRGRDREGLRRAVKARRGNKRSAGDQSRPMDRKSPDARQRTHDRSPRRSSAMGEVARKRSDQSHVSDGQLHWNRLGRRDRLTRVLSRESRTCAARWAAGDR